MRLLIVLCSLVFASAAFVSQPVHAQILDSGVLEGVVCTDGWDAECGDMLPGATVAVSGAGIAGLAAVEKQATTDENGFYRIEGLRSGDYTVTVSRAGFATATASVSISATHAKDFTLAGEQVQVAGSVQDTEGAPIPRAYVAMRGFHSQAEAMTDAEGTFEASVRAGFYHVEVRTDVGRYFEKWMLVDGSDMLLAFEPLPGQEALVSGVVRDQDGQPVVDATVFIDQWRAQMSDGSTQHGNFRNATTTGSDGSYAIHAYGGDISIEVRKAGYSEAYDWLWINATDAVDRDFELMKYPAKTARISGSVTNADGEALPFVQVRIELPEYGLNECSQGNRSYDHAVAEPMSADVAYSSYRYEPEPCAIQMDGGSFAGTVTPGYAILTVRYDRWAACDETHHADGSYERKCGPDYFTYTQTLQLQPDADQVIDVVLEQRPGPDAAISGYAVDGETGKAIPGAWFSFNHQDSYGWGSASTDQDGSYKVRLRSGYQHVEVWAEGYLPWQGTVRITPGQDVPFDVELTPGQARYGGCCYHAVYAHDASSEATSSSPGKMSPQPARGGGDGAEYEDMQGGLGPYDAAQRAALLQTTEKGKDAPSPMAFAVAGVALALLVRRKRL